MGVAIEPSVSLPLGQPETAGSKIKKFLDSQDGYRYEAGEILPSIFRDLEKIILDIRAKNKDIPVYYIVTHSQKNPFLGGALHLRTWWRYTRPEPGFNLDCYKVTNPGDHMTLEWVVPSEAVCLAIQANPSAYDPVLAKNVVEFLAAQAAVQSAV